ncbi:MAG: aldo/keto reductase [Flavobacteriaceae bacterium]|nr:aldo/keto reductase [Flavobacteriaceae bacterium]
MIKNIGLGTAAIGRPQYINIKQEETTAPFSLPKFKEKGLQILENAYQSGIKHFDTSPGYGIAEDLMIEWLKGKNDSSIEVSTKWGYTYTANFDSNADTHEVKEHSLEKLNEQWEISKQLLPYLKVYQIHSATFDSGVLQNETVIQRLHQIRKEHNLIIGLSTTGSNQVEVLNEALKITFEGEKLFQSVQCTFNILDQGILKVKEQLENLKGPIIIKEALANGRLIPNDSYFKYKKLYEFLNQLAQKYNVNADAIALRYCIDSFKKAIVLSGPTNNRHLQSNLKATELTLTNSELEQLNAFGIESETYWTERKQLQWN